LATAGESVAGDLGCPAVGSHKRSSAAESSKDHLSVAGPGLGSGKLQHWKLNCT
jgi:hypothetical protein